MEWIAPCCTDAACVEASYWVGHTFLRAVWRRAGASALTIARCRANAAVEAVVAARDDRELSGVGIDWSKPVDGWTLFAAGLT